MSPNSSNHQPPLRESLTDVSAPHTPPKTGEVKLSRLKRTLLIIGLPVWTFLGFMLAQALIYALVQGLVAAGVPVASVSDVVLNTMGAAAIYALAIFIVIGMPWFIKRRPTTAKELGISVLPTWFHILWVPAAYIVYAIASSYFSALMTGVLPFIDTNQAQDTGYAELTSHLEYSLAFIALVIIAPLAEELLFRGYLFGKLKKYTKTWVAILITSVLFGIVHFQWNVGLDVFMLSIVLCLLRIYTGSLWPSILLHMLKNGIAYYFLFINPTLLSTMG